MSARFSAAYTGRCAECDDVIEPGDSVRYTRDDELCHADCIPDAEESRW